MLESVFFAVLLWVGEAGFAKVVVVLDGVATGAGGWAAKVVDLARRGLAVAGGSHTFG